MLAPVMVGVAPTLVLSIPAATATTTMALLAAPTGKLANVSVSELTAPVFALTEFSKRICAWRRWVTKQQGCEGSEYVFHVRVLRI